MWNDLYVATFQILSVCTANICRSPAAETFLRHDLAEELSRGYIAVNSFGTHAIPDRAACELATVLVGAELANPPVNTELANPRGDDQPTNPGGDDQPAKPRANSQPASPVPSTQLDSEIESAQVPIAHTRNDLEDATPVRSNATGLPEQGLQAGSAPRPAPDSATPAVRDPDDSSPNPGSSPPRQSDHSSRRVTKAGLQPANLILALDREHRSALARVSPASRPRTFTVRQAAVLATHIQVTLSSGELPQGAPPLPPANETRARLIWLVEEMDAARGVGGQLAGGSSPEAWHPLDIPDPHVIGFQIHPSVVELIRTETRQISSAIRTVLRA